MSTSMFFRGKEKSLNPHGNIVCKKEKEKKIKGSFDMQVVVTF